MNWKKSLLYSQLLMLVQRLYLRYRWCDAKHPFWRFYWQWKEQRVSLIRDFIAGHYLPQPKIGYNAYGDRDPIFYYQDALMQKLLYRIIKPTFKHMVSPACHHLKGPGVIKTVTHHIADALASGRYRYVIRTDIKSYYASINHHQLQQQIRSHFNDHRVVRYLCDWISSPIDRGGWYEHPTKGISIRSSLSGFLAALYLKPLDLTFDHRDDIFYCRYNDDILILCQTKRQYARAKKRLKMIIHSLQLTLAPKKTQMGKINKRFHFLGVQYDVAQTSAWPKKKEDTLKSIKVSLHPRSIRRSIDKIRRKQETMALLNKKPTTAEHPASVHRQRYRWANWWARQHPQLAGEVEHVKAWMEMAGKI